MTPEAMSAKLRYHARRSNNSEMKADLSSIAQTIDDLAAGIVPIAPPDQVKEIAKAVGGTVTEAAALPDGSGFAVVSMPLPETHWIYGLEFGDAYEPPPMPIRLGDVHGITIEIQEPTRERTLSFPKSDFLDAVRAAGRYAVRSATMKGKETDFDPDALIQNLVVGFCGYHTLDGRSSDEWANPPHERGFPKETTMDDTPDTAQPNEQLPPLADPPEGPTGLGETTGQAPDAPDTTQPASDKA